MPNRTNNAPERLALPISTLRPGYLVSLRTLVSGNVTYSKEIIEAEHKLRSGAEKKKWQTERTITDPEEYKKAEALRLKARVMISSICARSVFGLLCPADKLQELNEAEIEATRLVNIFNRRAKLTNIGVYVVKGEIARDDIQAARAIKGEVREILAAMGEGVKNLDVATIRDNANRLKNIGSMLSPEVADQIKEVIDKGRSAARKIVKTGEDVAQEIDREAVRAIREARTAFLDIDMPDVEIGTPEGTASEVDVEEGELTPRVVRRRLQEA